MYNIERKTKTVKHKTMAENVQILISAVDKASPELSKVKDNLQGLSKETTNAKKQQESLAMSIAKGLVAFDLVEAGINAVRNTITGVINLNRQWESSFTGVVKTFGVLEDGTETLEQGLKNVSKGLIDMSKTMPQSASQLAGIAEIAGQLGVKGSEGLLEFTKTIAMLGDTTNIVGEEGALQLAKVLNVMKVAPAEASNFGSAIVALGNNMATTEADILAFANRLSGTANLVGISSPAMLGLAGALSSLGIEAEFGGTAMQKFFTDMQSSVITGGDNLQRFANVSGMSVQQFTEQFRKAPELGFASFVAGLDNIQKAGGNTMQVLADMGFSETRLQQLLLKSASAHETVTEAVGLAEQAYKDNIAMVQEAETRYGTFDSQLAIFKNNISAIVLAVTTTLIPAMKTMLKIVLFVINTIIALVRENKTFITVLLVTAGTFGALMLSVKAYTIAVGLLSKAIGLANIIMKIFMANPVIAFLSLLAGAVVFVINKVGGFGNAFLLLVEILKIVGNAIVGVGKMIGNVVIKLLNSLIGAFTKTFDFAVGIANKFGANMEKIGDKYRIQEFDISVNTQGTNESITAIKNIWSQSASTVENANSNMQTAIQYTGQVATETADILNDTVGGGADKGAEKVSKAMEKASESFEKLKTNAVNSLENIAQKQDDLEKNTLSNFQSLVEKRKSLDTDYQSSKNKLYEDIKDKEGSLLDLYNKHKESLDSINQSIQEQQNKSVEATKSYQKSMLDIAKSTEAVQKKLRDLDTSFQSKESGDKGSVAEKVVRQQQEAEKLRAEIAEGGDARDIERKQETLARIEADLSANAGFIQTIQAQIDEVKRVSALGEIARAVEEYNQKRALAIQEYNEKKALYQQELVDLGTKRAEETAQYQAKLVEIQGEINALNIKRVQELANYSAKRQEVNNEILDIRKKIEENDIEYQKKRDNIQKEIADLQASYLTKSAEYKAHQDLVTGILQEAETIRANTQASTTAKNLANINAEIEAYKRLAEAMKTGNAVSTSGTAVRRQFGGFVDKVQYFASGGVVQGQSGIDKVPAMLSAGEVVLNAGQQRNVARRLQADNKEIVINVNGNNFYGNDKEFASKIGDIIMKEFVKHTAFESF